MKCHLFFITLICLSSNLISQSSSQIKLHEILAEQQNSWNQSNLAGFMKHYWKSDSLTFVSKNGVKRGWQSVYDGYQKNYADKGEMGILNFEIFKVELLSKKNALVLGSWKVVNAKGTYQGYFTLWFKKIKRKWVIVQDHTS